MARLDLRARGQFYLDSAACIKGHRSSSCAHNTRPLFTIRSKGRPVTQCDHCRQLRKTKQVHVKCECDSANNASNSNLAAVGEEGEISPDGVSMIVTRKGARKVKTLEPAMAAYPNGIQDILDGAKALSSLGGGFSLATDSGLHNGAQKTPSCTCNNGGNCTCATPRFPPKKNQDNSGKKPSISLTIPPSTNTGSGYYDQTYNASGLSPGGRSPQILVTPVDHDEYSSQSHPHQHHALNGHHIGAGQNDHHSRHAGHYTPYSPQHHRSHHHGSPGSVSPCSPSPGSPSGLPMTSPTSATAGGQLSASTLLAPPGSDFPYALHTSLMNLSTTTSMGLDINRPRSALSVYTGTGPTTPVESTLDSSYFPGADSSSWMMGRTNSNESGGISGYSASSPGSSSPLPTMPNDDMVMLSLFGNQEISNNQLQGPSSPLQSDAHLSLSMQNGGNGGQAALERQFAAMTAQGAAIVPDFRGSAVSDDGHGDYDVNGDGDDQVLQRASADLLLGLGQQAYRRRGSHASIASSNGGGNGSCGVQIRLMSASPVPPITQSSPVQNSPGGSMLHNMQLLELSGNGSGGCGAPGSSGCHCWSATGSPVDEIVRCRKENCPCCQHLTSSPNRPSAVDHYPFGLSPQTVPPGMMARSRSSSSASHRSTSSVHSFGSVSDTSFGVAESSLSRANSTGALRQAGQTAQKYKAIRPKPCDSLPEVNQVTTQHQQHHRPNSLPTSTNASGITTPSVVLPYKTNADSYTFPRASFVSEGNSNPFVSSSDGGIDMQSPVDGMEGTNIFNQLNANFGDSSPSSASYSQNNFNNAGPQADMFASDFSNNNSFSMPDMANNPFSVFSAEAAAPSSSSHSRTHSHSSILSSASSATSSSSYYNNNQPRQSLTSPSRQNTIVPTTASNSPVFGHERSRSFANYTNTASSSLLEEPRPMGYTHGRSVSASFLEARNTGGLSPIELIVTPASPFPGSMS